MDSTLHSATFVICLALQVSSQLPPKPIGEWHPDRYEMYPNPWVNISACRMQEPSGLCDVNGMLTDEERKYFGEQPEMKNVSTTDRCLCNKSCGAQMRIMVIVTIMKKIGPQITDYKAAGKEFAEKFRANWNLINCSVILIASKGDNMSFFEAGPGVIKLLPVNETEQVGKKIKEIDQRIYEKLFSTELLADGLNETLIEYRKNLAEMAAKEMEKQKNSADKIIVGVLVGVLVVVIVIIIVVIVSKLYKRKTLKLPAKDKEEERLNEPKAV